MNGISYSEFYNKLYFGADIDFEYKNAFYHINSGYDEKKAHSITVYVYDKHPDETPDYYNEILTVSNEDAKKSIDEFFGSAIFEGKTLNQIDEDITVIYS